MSRFAPFNKSRGQACGSSRNRGGSPESPKLAEKESDVIQSHSHAPNLLGLRKADQKQPLHSITWTIHTYTRLISKSNMQPQRAFQDKSQGVIPAWHRLARKVEVKRVEVRATRQNR